MTDREKVIKGLEICSEHGSWHGLDCKHNGVYRDCPYRGCETGTAHLAADALALLKEQPDIVRCKECKYYSDGFCYNPNTFDDEKTCGNTVPDWYCADGKRRETND